MKATDMSFALERSFVASEFLTWLWFRCEVEGGVFELPEGAVSLAVEDGLTLASWDEDGIHASLRGGTPTRRPEAADALASGLLLRRARLIAARGDREWLFTLDESFHLSGVKIIETAPDDDPEDPLADKLAAGEELKDVVDGIFRDFLRIRLAPQWDDLEVPRLKDWVQDKVTFAYKQVGVG